jgi:NAD(P)-dependent dehydrogenase (short-subunit alcohol dehydrogenase family)
MVSADRAGSRTFVVTGAASGIGLATAAQTSAQGPRWCTGNASGIRAWTVRVPTYTAHAR